MKNLIKIFLIIFIWGFMICGAIEAQKIAKNVFTYDSHDKRDPFWSLVSEDGTIVNYDNDFILSDLILEGIILDAAGKNLAIINGQILKSQDMIGQFTIVTIERDHVVVDKKGQQFTLYLKKEE